MELVGFAKEIFQNVAEHVASYRIGQSALRHVDRALWVVEKCARWAVPPPLDADERPQPELVRPLPWVFFLSLLVALRVTRESISIVNLFMGKPPLRSADVVMYIQGKRRYLRTLKYQGNRMMRARTSASAPAPTWHSRLQVLMDLTMCFRGSYGNNNTVRHSNNDEVLVVKRSKRGRQSSSPVASTSETTMERLIEKMMVDLDADSDDSSFTLTNVTSVRSDRSDTAESEPEIVAKEESKEESNLENGKSENTDTNPTTSPEKVENHNSVANNVSEEGDSLDTENSDEIPALVVDPELPVPPPPVVNSTGTPVVNSTGTPVVNSTETAVEESQLLLNSEKNSHPVQRPKNDRKVGNGKASIFKIRKEQNNERRNAALQSNTVSREANIL